MDEQDIVETEGPPYPVLPTNKPKRKVVPNPQNANVARGRQSSNTDGSDDAPTSESTFVGPPPPMMEGEKRKKRTQKRAPKAKTVVATRVAKTKNPTNPIPPPNQEGEKEGEAMAQLSDLGEQPLPEPDPRLERQRRRERRQEIIASPPPENEESNPQQPESEEVDSGQESLEAQAPTANRESSVTRRNIPTRASKRVRDIPNRYKE